jgi:rhodanese-related sulfurtransferase
MKTINTYEDLGSIAFQQRLKETQGAVLLDVRTSEEFQEGRIPGSVNIDVTDITFPERVNSLDKSKTYFVYCRSGGRSQHACSSMNRLGLTVVNLAGGILRWTGEVI